MPGPESLSPNDPKSFGDYSVVGRLGKGGQGVVYLGRNPEGEEVAIKVLNDQWSQDDDLRKRFEKEVRAAQKVASFCTAAIHEAQLDKDPPYVVSEYVPGQSLQEAVATKGPHKGAALQRLAVSTATALVAIHQAGIVHRDFKPGNVLLGPDGPRVIDFGIARVADGTATLTNSIVGTPSYMAPEQIEGRGITDKVDIFAWGCVVAFASTGNAPFGQDSVPAVVHRVVSAPPNLDGVPDSLLPIVQTCLDKDPARRPTAQELLMRLLGHESAVSTDDALKEGERIAESGPPLSGPQTPIPPSNQVGGYAPMGGMAPGHTPSGPQTPFPGYGPGPAPNSGPQAGFPHQPPRGPQPHGPNVTGVRPGPAGPPHTGPNTMYGGRAMPTQRPQLPPQGRPPQQVEDPILSHGWVVPAVLIAIIILVLVLFLAALST
ncbi:serine/threonine-protein kinase [Streptomonospora nanhaiensis]|uniref:Serine/threonine protein kinase n=1 Tax=Streptomonospora nanhaiensis TaxID=1323731 RepID=A0A853BN55_9ACTN|nr:serine/threonine-protein kinase [Streptomonospora nanhaiensis]MBV2362085.1 protein kinase [Streptomonospora nanhaiensis]NYI96087.1 serine/threonine protein kinase [Streptomonospora nanhaiensis]